MPLLKNTNFLLLYLYRLLGIIQFSTNDASFACWRIWCLPLYSYFLYAAFLYTRLERDFQGIFRYVDQMAGYCGLIAMCTSAVMFFIRSNELKSLLIKVDSMEIHSVTVNNKHPRQDNLVKLGMTGLLILHIVLFTFWTMPDNMYFFYLLPPLVNALDHLFLNDILNCLCHKFDLINQQFQRQIDSVDLFVIFPLSKIEKVRILKEDEITFNIQRIQELSHLHYSLINLTTKISALFELTTITGMVAWFGFVINSLYFMVHVTIRDAETEPIMYILSVLYIFFSFYWLFVMVAMFSRTQKKANQASTYVHDIWNKHVLRNEVDKRVRHLQLISLRMLNTRLHFTAKDFFNLDWTFCHMMIAATTTYLVILIQFNFY